MKTLMVNGQRIRMGLSSEIIKDDIRADEKESGTITEQKALELVDIVASNREVVQVKTNHGFVNIHPVTYEFTPSGAFGNIFTTMVNNHHAHEDRAKKFLILAANIEAYSRHVGGVTIS